MRRLFALLMVALAALSLSGCETLEQPAGTPAPTQEVAEAAEATPTVIPTPTPVPTPEPTPVPVVEVNDYKYQKVSNKALNITFEFPSHWINKPGSITICYVQPVNEGETAARVAVSVKKIKNLDQDGVKKELEKLSDSISATMQNFRHGSVSKKVKFLGSNAYSVVYEAEKDGRQVKGLIIVAVKNSKNRAVALHFYAPADRYKDFDPVLKQILGSVKLS